MRLEGEPERLAALERLLRQADAHELSPADRRTLLLCELLERDEPAKLFALAHELQVTTPTVTSDLDDVERWAAKDGLTLVRRRGYGVELAGGEARKRRAIARLALETLDESDVFGLPEAGGRPPHPVTARLLAMIGKPELLRVEEALWTLESGRAKESSEAAYTRRLVLLSVSLARYRAGRRLQPAEAPRMPSAAANGAGAGSGNESAVDPAAAPDAADALGRLFGLELPPAEVAYLNAVAAADDSEESVDPEADVLAPSAPSWETAAALIRAVERRTDVPLAADRQLRDGLLQHLEPALARMLEGEPIRNPLLQQIKRDYEPLFLGVRDAAREALPELDVPDEEVGFLALHFGAALERAKRLPRSVRALLVCTSGIGSSKMLAVRLAKEFPQVEIVGSASWYEAVHRPESTYDLIVSTVDLPLPPDQYVKLSPLLAKDEADRLRAMLRRIAARGEPAAGSGAAPANGGADDGGALSRPGAFERLRELARYADGAVRLLERFAVHRLAVDGRDLQALLREACRRTAACEACEEVAERLIDRERQGSLLIPDSDLALFHTRSEAVAEPSVALFRLDEPAPTLDGDRRFERFVLLLAPKRLPKRELELLSEISAMLLQQHFIETLESDDASRIVQYMSNQLEAYIKNHIEWSV